MHIAVVYESLFGNTHEIAEAIAHGTRAAQRGNVVECLPIRDAGSDSLTTDLLVVGGPTHSFGMPSERSRRMQQQYEKSVANQGQVGPAHTPAMPEDGVRTWLDNLPTDGNGRPAAAFDTRLDAVIPGGAANRIARNLRQHGYRIVAEPKGFIVEGMAGPLRSGERERAMRWGAELAQKLAR